MIDMQQMFIEPRYDNHLHDLERQTDILDDLSRSAARNCIAEARIALTPHDHIIDYVAAADALKKVWALLDK